MNRIDVNAGWDAFDSKGNKIGSIIEQRDNCVVVSKGTFFPKDIYVPFSAVQRADSNEHRVYLNVLKDDIESYSWDDPNTLATDQTTGWDTDTTSRSEPVGTMRTERTGYGDQGFSDERLGGVQHETSEDRKR